MSGGVLLCCHWVAHTTAERHGWHACSMQACCSGHVWKCLHHRVHAAFVDFYQQLSPNGWAVVAQRLGCCHCCGSCWRSWCRRVGRSRFQSVRCAVGVKRMIRHCKCELWYHVHERKVSSVRWTSRSELIVPLSPLSWVSRWWRSELFELRNLWSMACSR